MTRDLASILALVTAAEHRIAVDHDHSDFEALIDHLAPYVLGSPRLLREAIERAWQSGLVLTNCIADAAERYDEQTRDAGEREAMDMDDAEIAARLQVLERRERNSDEEVERDRLRAEQRRRGGR